MGDRPRSGQPIPIIAKAQGLAEVRNSLAGLAFFNGDGLLAAPERRYLHDQRQDRDRQSGDTDDAVEPVHRPPLGLGAPDKVNAARNSRQDGQRPGQSRSR